MNALAKLFGPVGSNARNHRHPLLAVALALAFALSATALAQHAGGSHGEGSAGVHVSGGGYGYGGHRDYGHGYYGRGCYGHGHYGHRYCSHGYYGYGYYGGWGDCWGPWAFAASLPVLPWYDEADCWNRTPYYYAIDTYCRWNAAARGYEVVPAPGGSAEAATGSGGAVPVRTELFSYPMKGQTTAQQSQDRCECHRWATDPTAIDPPRPMAGCRRARPRRSVPNMCGPTPPVSRVAATG